MGSFMKKHHNFKVTLSTSNVQQCCKYLFLLNRSKSLVHSIKKYTTAYSVYCFSLKAALQITLHHK